ncbi:MAG: DAK2 domain-containing protein [Actinomycetota bacterium]|nr:DAK2 domain-containing protein [Actinomycetota bacterium]
MLEALDADAVRRWSHATVQALRAHQSEIDDLNVFPVPDGDTGTNMALTMAAADEALTLHLADAAASTAASALQALARGSVLAARGNSGIILSQLLRGIADGASRSAGGHVDAANLCAGFQLAADQAWQAVADPVDGTILSVARAAAEAGQEEATMAGLVRAVLKAAQDALAATPRQLAPLAQAGVVDAGGRGLVLVLAALADTVTGDELAASAAPSAARPAQALRSNRESGSDEFEYEVQYLLDADEDSVAALRVELGALGDCVAAVGTGDGIWNVHAHVNDVGACIEKGVEAGRPHRITVVRFDDEASDRRNRGSTAVVAVAPGDGLAHLFEEEGVLVVDGRGPTVADVLLAIVATASHEVVLLPNASRIAGVAQDAADLARARGIRVTVVPTRSPVQGLAAVAVHDPVRRFDDDVVAMAEAAAATRYAELTVAEHESLTSVGICQQGDVLGLIDGEVVEIGRSMVAVVFALTDRLLGVGAELMTVLVGGQAPAGIGDLIVGHVQSRSPLTEVSVYAGGQLNFPIIIGVE